MTGHASFSPGEPLMLTLCLEEDSILVSKAILETLEHPKQAGADADQRGKANASVTSMYSG